MRIMIKMLQSYNLFQHHLHVKGWPVSGMKTSMTLNLLKRVRLIDQDVMMYTVLKEAILFLRPTDHKKKKNSAII